MKLKSIISIILIATLMLVCGCNQASPSVIQPEEADKLYVYFLDVGQADCALAVYQEDAVLIDGGNVGDSGFVINFIKNLGIKQLTAVIATHPHEDHIGGLGAVISKFPVGQIFSPVAEYESNSFDSLFSAAAKQSGISVPEGEVTFSLGEVKVTLLSLGDFSSEETNNTSIVTKITYLNTAYLFMGDLEHDGEVALVQNNADLRADVLKVGHHGSNTSTSYLFLRAVLPQIAVISCGENNSYNHPHTEIIERLTQAEAKIYRTDLLGTVSTYSDGSAVYVLEKGGLTEFTPDPSDAALEDFTYIGNKNSKVFHLPACASLPKEENRVFFALRDDALTNGYTPCGKCKP